MTQAQAGTALRNIKIQNAEEIIRRRVDRLWVDRALEMLRHMTDGPLTTISNLRITTGWPTKGSITFTRDADNKRIEMRLRRDKFVAVCN